QGAHPVALTAQRMLCTWSGRFDVCAAGGDRRTPEQAATAERDARSQAAAHALIAERGLGRFATFYEVSEGHMHPDGTESMSGYVVVEDGREFYFWMDWDPELHRPRLGT